MLLVRISGKRTLAKVNAFDPVVTVALGSILATMLLNRSITLAEGVPAFALLIGLQYLVTWTSVRSGILDRPVRSKPSLLLHRGRFPEETMRAQRVTRDEVASALRASGVAVPGQATAVVL